MSTCCSKHVEAWNKYIEKSASSRSLTRITANLKFLTSFHHAIGDNYFIREVPSPNLGWQEDFPDGNFRDFTQSLQILLYYLQIRHDHFDIVAIHDSLINVPFDAKLSEALRRYIRSTDNDVSRDAGHRLHQTVPYSQNATHYTVARECNFIYGLPCTDFQDANCSTALRADFLYRISPKTDHNCGK